MKLEDIKVGMKVKLLGKHGRGDWHNNIEDWYEDCYSRNSVKTIKTQGYGVVIDIEDDEVGVSDRIDGYRWSFTLSDLEPYEETIEESTSIKTPKEWLLTPKAIFITVDGNECMTFGNNTAYVVYDGTILSNDLNEEYNEDLIYIDEYDGNDIMQITYNGEIVWKRKEYMTLTDAIKTGKKIKLKNWFNFICPTDAMLLLSNKTNDELINLFTDKVWEVE